ncbi:MAG TPA: FtsW/RodA/SpoVE family cell cycle protein [Candidatus Kaiserbacteria bacterium]|nr:FtsW/RodA/SpoVE family cell cycle protein [Candidatus Kaiserbacteria bacterium]
MKSIDRSLYIITGILVISGFFIFTSASLGLLAREGARFSSVAFSQIFFGMILGTIFLLIMTKIKYRILKHYALYIFILSILGTLLVFVPEFGSKLNGAKRWIYILGFSFQPAEFLKLGFVLYLAAYLSGARNKIGEFKHGLIPFILILGIPSIILLLQPDTGTVLVLVSAGTAMYVTAGGKMRDFLILLLIGVISFSVLVYKRPYIKDRLETYIQPGIDLQSSGYQLNQSLIAIGSGGVFGRGFGQSVQKFNYLPEPIGDSIFAVAAEEFGFVGAFALIFLFLLFSFRGLKIASRAPDYFSGLLVVGIVILIISQSFINIGSMLGVFPLTGLPLLFISHGGTAMFFVLGSVGIILNISKYLKS